MRTCLKNKEDIHDLATYTSKATKARVEKHGQHKLGQGGYGKLKARILNTFQTVATEEDRKLGFKYSFKTVIEYQRSLEQTPISSAMQMQCNRSSESSGIQHRPLHTREHMSNDSGEQSTHSAQEGELQEEPSGQEINAPIVTVTQTVHAPAQLHPRPSQRRTRSMVHEHMETQTIEGQGAGNTVLEDDYDTLIVNFMNVLVMEMHLVDNFYQVVWSNGSDEMTMIRHFPYTISVWKYFGKKRKMTLNGPGQMK